ncbi:hypothetical protein R1flu_002499 [Riccia fluitans]|uniref:Uncharacterized protein n=1 Tax=Riccia fluitans TaxID=41844 RepID=A0ABD1YA48_9MARC
MRCSSSSSQSPPCCRPPLKAGQIQFLHIEVVMDAVLLSTALQLWLLTPSSTPPELPVSHQFQFKQFVIDFPTVVG